MTPEDREILEAIHRELDEGDGDNAPGHAHSRPGIWDDDNKPEKAGKPCAWCLTWAKFTRLIQRGQDHTFRDHTPSESVTGKGGGVEG